jgi:hypothetical protein
MFYYLCSKESVVKIKYIYIYFFYLVCLQRMFCFCSMGKRGTNIEALHMKSICIPLE